MKAERFQSVILAGHKGAAVEVPFDPSTQWGTVARPIVPGRRGVAVEGKIDGIAIESCIVARSKRFWLLVDESVLVAAGIGVGDTAKVMIRPVLGSGT